MPIASIATIGSVVATTPQLAQAGPVSHPEIKELVKKIEERDTIISDLRRRVEKLEGQVAGTKVQTSPNQQPATASTKPAAQPAVPAAETRSATPTKQASQAAAPGEFTVDEQAAERALERTLVRTGALLLPVGVAEFQPGFAYSRRERDGTALPVIPGPPGGGFALLQKIREDNFIGDVFLRFGLPFDSQFEFGVPYRHINQELVTNVVSNDASGFGDIRVGLAKTLLHEGGWRPNLIGRVTWDTDTGEDEVSGGFHELDGSLTATVSQDPLVFIGSFSYGTTFEKKGIDPGDQLGFSVGALLAASPETSLRVVMNQSFSSEGEFAGKEISGSNQVGATMNFGASTIIGRGQFLDLTAGMGLTDDSPDYTVGLTYSSRFDVPPHF
jgi:hypothetical protein